MTNTKVKWIAGYLIIILSLSGVITYQFGKDAKFKVDEDKATFYTLEDSRWKVSGREITTLWDGTSKLNRKTSQILLDHYFYNKSTLTWTKFDIDFENLPETELKSIRTTPYKENMKLVETWSFDASNTDIELFPVEHTIEWFNFSDDYYLQYTVSDLIYKGDTWKFKDEREGIDEHVSSMSFGRNMKVVWEDINYYGKVFNLKTKKDKIVIKYKPYATNQSYYIDNLTGENKTVNDEYFKINVRLFDPPWDDGNYTSGGVGFWNGTMVSTTVLDASGEGHNGTATGNVNEVTMGGTSFLDFDGAGDYVTVADGAGDLDFNGKNLTISLWVNLTTTSVQNALICKGAASGIYPQYCIFVNTNAKLYFFAGGHNSGVVTDTTLNTSTLYHIVVTFQLNNTVTIYINGVFNKHATHAHPVANTAEPLFIGLYRIGDYKYLNGNMTGISLYSEIKNATWVSEVYAEGPEYQFEISSDIVLNITSISITPTFAYTNTGYLQCNAVANISESVSYEWLINGALQGTQHCYQETANVSTSCGGLSTGTYECAGSFQAGCTGGYDGNYSTGIARTVDSEGSSYIYENYTKTTGSINESKYNYKGYGSNSSGDYYDIPQSCWDFNNDMLSFRLESAKSGATYSNTAYCMNSTDWEQIIQFSAGGAQSAYRIVYEAAMNWTYSNVLVNTNFTINDNVTCRATAINGTYNDTKNTSVIIGDITSMFMTLNNINDNVSYEHGSMVEIRANNTNSSGDIVNTTICIDIDHPSFGVNVSCSAGGNITYNWFSATAQNKFNDSSTSTTVVNRKKVTFLSYYGHDESSWKEWMENGTAFTKTTEANFNKIYNSTFYYMPRLNGNTSWRAKFVASSAVGGETFTVNYTVKLFNYTSSTFDLYDSVGDTGVQTLTVDKTININNDLSSDYFSSLGTLYVFFNFTIIDSEPASGSNTQLDFYENTNDRSRINQSVYIDTSINSKIKSGFIDVNSYSDTVASNVKIYINNELSNTINGALTSEIQTLLTFNDSSSVTNVTFHTDPINDTLTTKYLYLYLPSNANVSNATFNMTGLLDKGYIDGETSVESNYSEYVSSISYLNRAYDDVWSNYFQFGTGGVGGTTCCDEGSYEFRINYTFENTSDLIFYNSKDVVFKMGEFDTSCTVYGAGACSNDDQVIIYFWNFTSSAWNNVYTSYYEIGNYKNITIEPDYLNVNKTAVKYLLISPIGQKNKRFWESGIRFETYPYNFQFKIGDNIMFSDTNGYNDSNITSNFASTINLYLNSCTEDSSGYCNIPLTFLSSYGKVEIRDLEVNYTTNFNPINLSVSSMQSDSINNNGRIELVFESGLNTNINISDVNITYYGAKNITITSHFDGNAEFSASNKSHEAEIYYSGWNYTYPSNVDDLWYFIYNYQIDAATPFGQTSTIPILNITHNNQDGNSTQSIYLNISTDCINISVSDNYNDIMCLQSYANESDSCGALGAGTYTDRCYSDCVGFNDTGEYCTAGNESCMYDNDWFTYTIQGSGGISAYVGLNVTYKKPYNAQIYGNKWEIKVSRPPPSTTTPRRNITIPSECIVDNYLNISMFVGWNTSALNIIEFHKCYNGTNWYTLYNEEISGSHVIYEEQMHWNITKLILTNSTWTNITYAKVDEDNYGIYQWLDADCSQVWTLFQPQIYLRACCDSCICSDNVTNIQVVS